MRRHRPGPFALPVRDIVRYPGEMREFSLDLPAPAKWGEGLVSIGEGEPVDIDVRAESVHEGILVSGTATAEYIGVCGRCLTDLARTVEVEFQELFAYPGSEETDFEVQDDHVDLETLVRDAMVLSLPFQPVCQPDCPGLDPDTGERLAEDTGTEHSSSIDPRWAVLQDLTTDHNGDPRRTAAPSVETSARSAERTEKS